MGRNLQLLDVSGNEFGVAGVQLFKQKKNVTALNSGRLKNLKMDNVALGKEGVAVLAEWPWGEFKVLQYVSVSGTYSSVEDRKAGKAVFVNMSEFDKIQAAKEKAGARIKMHMFESWDGTESSTGSLILG